MKRSGRSARRILPLNVVHEMARLRDFSDAQGASIFLVVGTLLGV